LTPADIAAAFVDDLHPMTGQERGWLYAAGVDLGLTRDCSAVVVLAVPADGMAGRIRLANHRLWRPTLGKKIDLTEVERHILELDQQYNLITVAFDPWQAEHMAQRLEADSGHRRRSALRQRFSHKPWMREIPPTAANLREQATLIIESFADRRFQFYDCEPLRRDLLKLRVEEKSYGIRLTSPRDGTGHGDTFSAFSLALLVGHELAGRKPFTVRSMLDPPAAPGETALMRELRRLDYENDLYQREMNRLAEGGADYGGQEEWRQAVIAINRLRG
jgi:hypothetical protein